MAISMLKIRRPLGRLIFNMEIAIPGKTVFLIETAPSIPVYHKPQEYSFQTIYAVRSDWHNQNDVTWLSCHLKSVAIQLFA